MINETMLRLVTSVLVLGSLPPLFGLLHELLTEPTTGRRSDTIEPVLFMIYSTFLLSGLITLYINTGVLFFNHQQQSYTMLALVRNTLKHIGILLVSWRLYFITKGR